MDDSFMNGEFSNVKKWVYRFLDRQGYSIRDKTHVAQKECDLKLCLDVVVYSNLLREDFQIHPDFVINMDETPCYYDNKPKKKVVSKGMKSVNGAKTRTGDYRATVCLSVSLSGRKLDPLVIFKGKPGKTNEKKANEKGGYSAECQYCFQESAWCDEEAMLKWVKLVLKPYLSDNLGLSHVIIDDYSSHKTPAVLKAIRNLGCIVTILPGGSTSQIQVLDVGINKPFKDRLKNKWVQFMVNENSSNDKDITRQMLSKWIADSFSDISSESIRSTFTRVGYY